MKWKHLVSVMRDEPCLITFHLPFFFHEKILKSSRFEDLCSTLSHPHHLIQSFTKPCGYYFSEISALTLTSLVPFALPRAHALITDRAPGSSSFSPLDLMSVTLLSNLQIDRLPSFPHTIPPLLMLTPPLAGIEYNLFTFRSSIASSVFMSDFLFHGSSALPSSQSG